MRIRVQHETGRIETIQLDGELFVTTEGPQLNRIRDKKGFEHFFTKEGFYDGWGSAEGPCDSK